MPRKCKPGSVFCLETQTILVIGILAVIMLFYYTNTSDFILNNFSLKSNSLNRTSNNNNNNNNTRSRRRRVKFNLKDNQIKEINNNDSNNSNDINNEYNRPNVNVHSYRQHLHNQSHSRVINPLLPPERSFEQTYGIAVNVPSRGISGGFQQVGMLYKETIESESSKIGNNSEPTILALYGRPTYPGSNKWSYYTASDKYHTIKMPFTHNGRKCDNQYGCDELYDDDLITLPAYNGNFRVKLYDFDKPRYIPYVW